MHPVLEKANQILHKRKLTLKHNTFNHVVQVQHGDGTTMVFQNATSKIRIIDGCRMLLVWTEHCGYHAFFCEDLEFWRTYKSI